jgi:chromate reductase
MVYRPKILAFAGSLRSDSYNKKMIHIASQGAQNAGCEVTIIDLKDFPLPVYDQDIEDSQGLPANAIKLKELFKQHDGLLISCPEYNSSIPGGFKNMIDWVSRKATPDEAGLICFTDKVVALMSASPGALGGLRGLVHVRAIFGNINSLVLPQQKCVSTADKAFDDQGKLQDPKQQTAVENLGKLLADFLKKLKT